LAIAYTYGWRIQNEVLALERRQVDLDNGTLRLDPGTTKNDEGRVVYLTPELNMLRAAQLERVERVSKQIRRIIPVPLPSSDWPSGGEPEGRLQEGVDHGMSEGRCAGDVETRPPAYGSQAMIENGHYVGTRRVTRGTR
jgi:hypothetical protein